MTELDVSAFVADRWRSSLGLVESGGDEDFFALGGNSLMAIGLLESVEAHLGIEFPLDVLFGDGRLSAIVAECERRYAARQVTSS